MSTYVIGDIHGSAETLAALLERVQFDPRRDRLWSVGDLVGRGPDPVSVLRYFRDLGDRATVVLGNHDVNLLAVAAGVRKARPRDVLEPVLEARDAPELVEWLTNQPLLHHEGDFVMVHAGLLPSWDLDTAERFARRGEARLRSRDKRREFLKKLFRVDDPLEWRPAEKKGGRVVAATAAMTRLRVCAEDERMLLSFKSMPSEHPPGYLPWFDWPRGIPDKTVLFGHWAALGLRISPGIVGLDSGCVWGGSLTALRLDDMNLFQQPRVDGKRKARGLRLKAR